MATTLSRLTQGNSLIIGGIIVIAVTLGSVGWYLQTADADITNESKADMFNFMADTYVTQKSFDSTIFTLENQLKESIEQDTQYATIDDYETLQEQIFNVRAEIIRMHPTSPSEDPANEANKKLVVKLRTEIVFLGQSINVYGTGEPNRPIFAFAIAPNRSIQEATVADENGRWSLDIETSFDDVAGTWSVRVTQDNLRAEPIVVTVR